MNYPDKSYFPFISKKADLEKLTNVLRLEITAYLKENKLQSLVLGISGGIDSAVCAALLLPVCNYFKIPLIGRSITIESNKKEEIDRSIAVGESFCHNFEYLDHTTVYFENKKNLILLDNSILSKMRQGNLKARMRMLILYDLAQLYRGMVISTDNFTEYLTGFWTLHGDVGDYAPLMNLWKTEVYHLAESLLSECNPSQSAALKACIEATPVDGLGISNSDCEQLGVDNYFEADQIFCDYFKGNKSLENHNLIKRFNSSAYKRNNPVEILRKTIIK